VDEEDDWMLIDAHSHLDSYGEDLESVLQEISQYQIFTIGNSVDIPSYQRNLAIAGSCDLVLPTFGVHPWKATEYVDCLEDLNGAIEQSPMIGEIGLDYHWVKDASQYPAQTRVFEFLLASAGQQGKTVNLHTKGAEKEIWHLLRRYGVQRAIIHWYSGPPDVLQAMAGYGYYFTIGVEVLCSPDIQAIARDLPSELLLTETDNPGGQMWLTGSCGRHH
jgi:TatD DNase family protein